MEANTTLQHFAQLSLTQNQPPSSGVSSSPTVTSTQPRRPVNNTLDFEARARKRIRDAQLRTLSRSFGHIPSVPIFSQWEKRNSQDCSDSAVHRSVVAGICGSAQEGAYSVVLSDSYKDNEDGGDVIIYTGAGGRERWTNTFPPKRLRVGPQTKDQSWEERCNKSLKISYLTGNPVRVVRSHRCDSKYAPLLGYRYDGLYTVAACWTAKGRNGKNICRCRLERLPDQPPIPLRPITMSTSRRKRRRLVSPYPPAFTDPYDDGDTSRNQPDVSPGQSASAGGPHSPPQQRAMSKISTGVDFNIGELNPDVKYPLPLAPQPGVSPKPSAPPTRYRWDPRSNKLTRVPVSDPIAESSDADAAGGDEEEDRAEGDDATLVPSEDGHADVSANERMETEYFSDSCDADEPHASGSSLMEN